MSAPYMPTFSPVVAALREAFPGRWVAANSAFSKEAICYVAEGVTVRLDERYPTRISTNFHAVATVGSLQPEAFTGPTAEWALAQAVVWIRDTTERSRRHFADNVAFNEAILAALPTDSEPSNGCDGGPT